MNVFKKALGNYWNKYVMNKNTRCSMQPLTSPAGGATYANCKCFSYVCIMYVTPKPQMFPSLNLESLSNHFTIMFQNVSFEINYL